MTPFLPYFLLSFRKIRCYMWFDSALCRKPALKARRVVCVYNRWRKRTPTRYLMYTLTRSRVVAPAALGEARTHVWRYTLLSVRVFFYGIGSQKKKTVNQQIAAACFPRTSKTYYTTPLPAPPPPYRLDAFCRIRIKYTSRCARRLPPPPPPPPAFTHSFTACGSGGLLISGARPPRTVS